MPFSVVCNNKDCNKLQEPYLNLKDNKVYCSLCDKEITNITHFVKIQMKSLKQFKQKIPKPFAVKCQKCGREDRPKLIKDDLVCSACNQILDKLSEPFKIMLKEKLKTVDKDI